MGDAPVAGLLQFGAQLVQAKVEHILGSGDGPALRQAFAHLHHDPPNPGHGVEVDPEPVALGEHYPQLAGLEQELELLHHLPGIPLQPGPRLGYSLFALVGQHRLARPGVVAFGPSQVALDVRERRRRLLASGGRAQPPGGTALATDP